MTGQFHTDICEIEPVPTDDEQYIQPVINEDDMCYNPMSVASPSDFQAKTFKTVNGKLHRNEQIFSEQASYISKYPVLNSELVPKKKNFVLKNGECARTCSTLFYYYSKSYPNVKNSWLAEEYKKNDSLIKPEDQKTKE